MNVERNKENIENINNNIAILVPLFWGGAGGGVQKRIMLNRTHSPPFLGRGRGFLIIFS